ncbi:hypothetical protein [Tsukamurella sputi]|uniref:hypothetical protein n=1 Tax=Tsukamurella sputi TaxID=2591848 RepID=UPI00131509DB|nr:hypothetical protein [Tsukamurella sputi]
MATFKARITAQYIDVDGKRRESRAGEIVHVHPDDVEHFLQSHDAFQPELVEDDGKEADDAPSSTDDAKGAIADASDKPDAKAAPRGRAKAAEGDDA